jgi:hypothetical protein
MKKTITLKTPTEATQIHATTGQAINRAILAAGLQVEIEDAEIPFRDYFGQSFILAKLDREYWEIPLRATL